MHTPATALILFLCTATASASGRAPVRAPAPAASLSLSGHVLFRFDTTRLDDGDDDSGFTLAQTRLILDAELSPLLGLEIEGGFEPSSEPAHPIRPARFSLRDALVRYAPGQGWELRLGQFDLPFLREELVSEPDLLAAEQSVVGRIFSLDRGQGAQVSWEGDRVRLRGMLSDGADGENLPYEATGAAIALTARADARLGAAEWNAFETFTARPISDPGALLGLAAHWQSGPGEDAGDLLSLTADVSYEGDGWSFFIAGVWRRTGGPGDGFDDWGLVAQGGLYVLQQAEVFARYAVVIADGARERDRAFPQLAVGFNYYFAPRSQAVRLTLEAIHHPRGSRDNELVEPDADLGLPAGDGRSTTLRAQLQLVF